MDLDRADYSCTHGNSRTIHITPVCRPHIQQATQTMTDQEEQLVRLGDPSGRQDPEYWDAWFQVVSCRQPAEATKKTNGSTLDQQHPSSPPPSSTSLKPFEWYCDPDEVLRVLSRFLSGSSDASSSSPIRILHAGSGTSLLPHTLLQAFDQSMQAIVDVSPVAIEQAQEVLLQLDATGSNTTITSRVEFLVSDLLDPPLPFPPSTFSAWIDKGFVDAVFSENNSDDAQVQKLFVEMRRLLLDNGVALIVSLAEDHSLRLVVEQWLLEDDASSSSSLLPVTRGWSPDLHICEMQPVSGTQRLFGFVLTAQPRHEAPTTPQSTEFRVHWHSLSRESDDGLTTTTVYPVSRDTAWSIIRDQVQNSRHALVTEQQQQQQQASTRMVAATLEIKPDDTEVDLVALARTVVSTRWSVPESDGDTSRVLSIRWCSTSAVGQEARSSPPRDDDNDIPDFVQVVPIGYGISKLVMTCVVESDDLENLAEAMEGQLEGVQSVDVDWEHTVPVADARTFHLPPRV